MKPKKRQIQLQMRREAYNKLSGDGFRKRGKTGYHLPGSLKCY